MPTTVIEIAKEAMGFSAAHFTIFDQHRRENLHGHNFRVSCAATAPVGDDGLCFDYGLLKRALKTLCDEFDERLLLPGRSPHLRVTRTATGYQATFGSETMHFLQRDALILPIANITVEALAPYLIERLRENPLIAALPLQALEIKVSSGSGQWGNARWYLAS